MLTQFVTHIREVTEIGGPIAAILFTGIALRVDARVRRAETTLEITRQHRELWTSFYDRPSLANLFGQDRDLTTHPLTDEEVHFVNFLLNHMRATFLAEQAKIFMQPTSLRGEMKEFFSLPSVKAVWEREKRSHEPKFVAFVESNLRD